MLQDNDFKEKTFEEMYSKSLLQIPLLTKEWTNFNASDPGITVLENITAFNVLQQTYINQINDNIRYMLLKLAGVEKKTVKSARTLLKVQNNGNRVSFSANQKFHVGNLCFENNRHYEIGDERIISVFYKSGDRIVDYSALLDRSIPYTVDIFGKMPKQGDELYFIINSLCPDQNELLIYFNVNERIKRNPADWNGRNPFAAVTWQILTDRGYADLKVKDQTECFLKSGMVRIQIPDKKLSRYEHFGYSGYAIRAVLTKADYDNAPLIDDIQGFLFEAWQKESKALCYTYSGSDEIEINCDMLGLGYVSVYCKEEGSKHYYRYDEYDGNMDVGRYYNKDVIADNCCRFTFSKERFGYAPGRESNAVKVVMYDEETMRSYHLDKVYGYDEQEIELPFENIMPESFSLIAMRLDENGEKIYDFIKENRTEDGTLRYSLNADKGSLCIHNVGEYVNAELFLCNLAVTMGEHGNIDAGKTLYPAGFEDIAVMNVCGAAGGRNEEPVDKLIEGFRSYAMSSEVAVTMKDYEVIARSTPGLCISKVKAIKDSRVNSVRIVAIPAAEDRFVRLSETYKDIMLSHINHYRLLSTRVKIVDAVYIPVDVVINCRIKSGYPGYESIVRTALENEIDFDKSNRNFGEGLQYEEVQRILGNLDCIESVDAISFKAKDNRYSKQQEVNITVAPNSLIYLDNVVLKAEFI